MDIFSSFATDEALETQGKWFTLSKTSSVLVARKDNDRYREYLRTVFKDNPLEGLPEDEGNKLAEQILLDAESRTILLGWKGLTFKGEDLPISVENARKCLEVKDFRKKILGFADSLESFRVKSEAEQKNA